LSSCNGLFAVNSVRLIADFFALMLDFRSAISQLLVPDLFDPENWLRLAWSSWFGQIGSSP
jgi:hypothetical protein